MKNTLKILSIFLITISCKAQTPVYDLLDLQHRIQRIPGAYHKDINNLLDPFEGTYVYTNGNTSLKIVLKKKVMSSLNDNLYEDMIVGEYEYIENGIEKINTLANLSVNYSYGGKHSIKANLIITAGQVGCSECFPNEKGLRGRLLEESTHSTAELIIRRVTENSIPAIKILVMWNIKYKKETDPIPPRASFPGGEYILTRQLQP